MIVADTDVLIDFLEGRAPAANRIALELDRGQLRTTVITRFELLAGAKTARQLKRDRDLAHQMAEGEGYVPMDIVHPAENQAVATAQAADAPGDAGE